MNKSIQGDFQICISVPLMFKRNYVERLLEILIIMMYAKVRKIM